MIGTRMLAIGAAWVSIFSHAVAESRIKDITSVQGIRDNSLIGYGLVIGLPGTGDSLKTSPFTETSLQSMLEKMGVKVDPKSIGSKNAAAVVVTGTLPPFVSQGSRLDVNVSSLGDATSLHGGILVMTPLRALNGDIYAIAQGPLAVGGTQASGQAASASQGVPTTGRIPNGAIMERDNSAEINNQTNFVLQLTNADFRTATSIASAINAYSATRFGEPIANAHDFRSVDLKRPDKITASELFADVGEILVEPQSPAKIVIDEKNGTIVMGSDVRLSPVAVSHGSIVIKVTETPVAVQPTSMSDGRTAILPRTSIAVEEPNSKLALLKGPTLEKLVGGLNRMGLKPTDIISILQSLKAAGALQAELVLQ